MRGTALVAALLVMATVPGAIAAPAEEAGPSVLVTLTKLEKGGLPRIVTAYGRAEPDPSARHMVTAPAAAVVGAISVRAGQKVAAGSPLVLLEPSPATAAAFKQAQSAVGVAADLTRRTRALVAQHLATAQQLAAAAKTEADARAALAALEAEGAGGAQILRAPFPAIVIAVSTSAGAVVAQGAGLVELARPNAVVLRAGVVPGEAGAVRPGDPVAITPLGGGEDGDGRVVLRGAVVDPQTGLVPVVIAPPQGMLLPGESAQARIVAGEWHGYVVPHSAVLLDDNGAPYVVQAVHGVARRVPVHILGSDGPRDVVDGGLDPSAPLVLAGNYQLDDGMRIRLAPKDGKPGR